MVAMEALCGTRIRYTCLFVHLVGDVLAGGVEEGGDSPGQSFHGVVDQSSLRVLFRRFRSIF
jgi:hypothetical protein